MIMTELIIKHSYLTSFWFKLHIILVWVFVRMFMKFSVYFKSNYILRRTSINMNNINKYKQHQWIQNSLTQSYRYSYKLIYIKRLYFRLFFSYYAFHDHHSTANKTSIQRIIKREYRDNVNWLFFIKWKIDH
jgi:hypothetical protein